MDVSLSKHVLVLMGRWRLVAPLLVLGLTSGCSIAYVDDDGFINTIGTARVRYLPATATSADAAGGQAGVVRVESFGLGFNTLPYGSSITLGYLSESFIAVDSAASVRLEGAALDLFKPPPNSANR